MAVIDIRNANVLDVDGGSLLEGRRVIVEGGVIKDIDAGSSKFDGALELDAKGATLMPGLIDAHVHITAYADDFQKLAQSSPSYVAAQAAQSLRESLLRGFTTIRDVGGADFGLSNAVEEGLFDGPRLLYGGKALSQTGGHADMRGPGTDVVETAYTQPGLGVIVDGVPQVRRAARAELRRGAHHVKIMGGGGAASPTDRLDSDQFSEDEIAAIVDEAAMANRYTVVHAYSARTIERASRLGVRSIEHGNFLDAKTAQRLKDRNCFMVPTLITYHATSKHGLDMRLASSTIEKINALVEPGMRAIELAREAGVPMAYGTDLVGRFLQQFQLSEFSLRREVVPADELIRSATTVAAELVQMDRQIGRIAPGYLADIIVVDGNPLRDITVLERPENNLFLVMKGGKIFKNLLS